MCLEIIYFVYMYKKDFALNNLQWLICHKTTPNQTKSIPLSHLAGPSGICAGWVIKSWSFGLSGPWHQVIPASHGSVYCTAPEALQCGEC